MLTFGMMPKAKIAAFAVMYACGLRIPTSSVKYKLYKGTIPLCASLCHWRKGIRAMRISHVSSDLFGIAG